MKNQWLYKASAAFMIVMLAVAALPVSSAYAATTLELVPTGNGNYIAWTNGATQIDEGTAAASCAGGGAGDYISSNTGNARESVTISLASVPDGATITSINVLARDRADVTAGGTYATFVRFNGTDSANSATHTAANAGPGGACSGNINDAFDVTDTVKNVGTTLEIGVIKINSGGATNNALRVGVLSAIITYTDSTAPAFASITRQTPATSPTNANTLVFLATFSEPVQNVDAADFVVTGTTATIAVAQVTTSTYTITLTGGDLAGLNGTVGLNLAAGQNITDTSANPLPTTEPATDETFDVDNGAPSVISLAIQNPATSPTNANTLVYRLTFSENVTNIDVNDFDVTNGTTAVVTAVTTITANTVFDLTVSGGDLNGFNGTVTVGFDITGGGQQNITDTAGNALPNPNNTASYLVDNTAPTVTINQAVGQADPTNNSPINFTVVFNEAPTGFATGDVTFPAPNTAGGTLVGTVTGGPTTFNVAVTGMTTAGNVVPSILAGVATDAAGNNNAAATFTDRTVAFVPKVNTTTTVNCAPNPVLAFAATTCTVSVTRASGVNSPSGTVTLGSTGAGTFSPATTCTLAGAGATTSCSVTYTPSAVGSGTHAISANYGGDVNFNASNGNQNLTVNQATSNVTVTCPVAAQPYTGAAQTPCTASYSTSDGLSGPLTPTYSNNTNVGTATANAVYAGDANHAGSNNSATFAISQATSSVAVVCPAVAQPYTGAAQTPCTASYSTSDGLSGPLTPTYSNNTNVGTATANAVYAGDANHAGSNNSATFAISQATSSVTVICPAVAQPYTGAAQTPCTASYSTSDGLSGPLTPTYSNNTNVGTATANAVYAGDANHAGSNNSATFAISQATSSVTVVCPAVAQPYTGAAQTPCTASYSTSDGLSGPLTPTYSNNTNVGIATANAVYAGDANHAGSNNSANFTIGQVSSTVTVTCPVVDQPFTGSAQTPCTAQATGVGMTPVDITASIVYSNNINVGTATADVSWPGDINHTGNTGSDSFVIGQATSTVTVSCPVSVVYTGAALTPCTAEATGAGMTPVDVTASLVYSNNTNVGTATADASWAGDASHTGNTGTSTFDITQDSQTITVTTSAPAAASNGSTFNVAATATSGLTVSFTTSGVCTVVDNGNGTADITMTSGTGTCSVFYDQAGDGNYSAAPQVQEDVTATEGPAFTSADNATFDVTFPGSFTITAIGNPQSMTISLAGSLPSGITFTDNGDGTATLDGTPALGTNGTYPLSLTADNGVAPNGTQSFTLTVKSGPTIGANGINSTPDTGDGKIGENESIIDTLGITKLTVQFSQDVYDDPTDVLDYGHDVTNPANYILVRSTTNSFATIDCAGGVVAPDVSIKVNSVTYDKSNFIATLSINDGFPLNVVGFYRLYVCGTTSIVDATNRGLELAGNGTTPGTDFLRNFRIATQASGGGGSNGNNDAASQTLVTSGFLIPVTGFAPDKVTVLPAQPADKAYTSMGPMTIEIPTLGVKFPIVGASIKNKTWDLTWLKDSVAYLEGSAYPTTAGNTVLTAHVQDANKSVGPFSDIKGMTVGQNIYIHVNGQVYVYQVQENSKISSTSITSMFKHEEDSWITLVTCEDFNAKTGLYTSRRMVRAVLISVIFEK